MGGGCPGTSIGGRRRDPDAGGSGHRRWASGPAGGTRSRRSSRRALGRSAASAAARDALDQQLVAFRDTRARRPCWTVVARTVAPRSSWAGRAGGMASTTAGSSMPRRLPRDADRALGHDYRERSRSPPTRRRAERARLGVHGPWERSLLRCRTSGGPSRRPPASRGHGGSVQRGCRLAAGARGRHRPLAPRLAAPRFRADGSREVAACAAENDRLRDVHRWRRREALARLAQPGTAWDGSSSAHRRERRRRRRLRRPGGVAGGAASRASPGSARAAGQGVRAARRRERARLGDGTGGPGRPAGDGPGRRRGGQSGPGAMLPERYNSLGRRRLAAGRANKLLLEAGIAGGDPVSAASGSRRRSGCLRRSRRACGRVVDHRCQIFSMLRTPGDRCVPADPARPRAASRGWGRPAGTGTRARTGSGRCPRWDSRGGELAGASLGRGRGAVEELTSRRARHGGDGHAGSRHGGAHDLVFVLAPAMPPPAETPTARLSLAGAPARRCRAIRFLLSTGGARVVRDNLDLTRRVSRPLAPLRVPRRERR